jgi:hypothetical protein
MMSAHTERNHLQTHHARALGSLLGYALGNQMIRPQRVRPPMLLVSAYWYNRHVVLGKVLFSLRPTHLMKQNLQSFNTKLFY